jgi:hypothetical protein
VEFSAVAQEFFATLPTPGFQDGAKLSHNVSTLSELLRKAAAGSEDEAGAEQVG